MPEGEASAWVFLKNSTDDYNVQSDLRTTDNFLLQYPVFPSLLLKESNINTLLL